VFFSVVQPAKTQTKNRKKAVCKKILLKRLFY